MIIILCVGENPTGSAQPTKQPGGRRGEFSSHIPPAFNILDSCNIAHHHPYPYPDSLPRDPQRDPHDSDAQVGSTSIKLQWEQPDHSGENIISYEMYWNDTYTPTVCEIILTMISLLS